MNLIRKTKSKESKGACKKCAACKGCENSVVFEPLKNSKETGAFASPQTPAVSLKT